MQVLKKQLGIEDHTNKNSTYEYIPNPDKQASIFSQPKISKCLTPINWILILYKNHVRQGL